MRQTLRTARMTDMRKFLHRFLPHHEAIKNNRWLKPFGPWLQQPNLWHLNRRSVAGGVAAGLFCGLIPGPLQMLAATVLAVMLRFNLPVALFVTLYTNPLTIVPLYLFAYEIGAWVSGTRSIHSISQLPQMNWQNWTTELVNWAMKLGEPLLIGLPLLALLLAITGYAVVRLFWRVWVVLKWRARKHR